MCYDCAGYPDLAFMMELSNLTANYSPVTGDECRVRVYPQLRRSSTPCLP